MFHLKKVHGSEKKVLTAPLSILDLTLSHLDSEPEYPYKHTYNFHWKNEAEHLL